jgi:hypothetical protein
MTGQKAKKHISRLKMFNFHIHEKELVKKLGQWRGGLEMAASHTVNKGIRHVETDYKNKLKSEFKKVSAFTLGAVKVQESKHIRKNGAIRQMEKINAVIGIRKMRGGVDHYLLAQEEGAFRSHGIVQGQIGVPLASAKSGGKVQQKYRLTKTHPDSPVFGGRALREFSSVSQQWAILQGQIRRNPGDLKKPFVFNNQIYVLSGKKLVKLFAVKPSILIKGRHPFYRATKSLTQNHMQGFFVNYARGLTR